MLKQVLKNQKGLTLIEVLAVLVILGIIAVIAVPLIGNLIKESENKATVAEGINIISAAKIAQAAGVNSSTNTWTDTELAPYISTSVGSYNSVTYASNEFTLDGHASAGIAGSTSTSVTEKQLADYLD